MWIETLVSLKKRSGKTLKQISDESGVPLGTLNKLFAGQTRDPKLETIKSVVHALGFTLNDLDEKENAPAPSDDGTEALSVEEVISAFVQAGIVPDGKDLTDEDLKFLESILSAIERWFAD